MPALKFLTCPESGPGLVGTVTDRFSGSGGRSRVEILEPGLGKDC